MARIDVNPATVADLVELAPCLRVADANEVWAAYGQEPLDVLLQGLRASSVAWTVRVDGDLLGVAGLVPLAFLYGIYTPWVMTTTLVERHPKTFFQVSRSLLRHMRGRARVLTNFVDARYLAALRWVRRLGFEVAAEPRAYGARGLPFYEIRMEGD